MPLGLFKKVGNYRWSGGLGQSPQRGPGAAPWWGFKLELFLNQNCPESHQLTRMVVTHVYNTCTGEIQKEKKKKEEKKKKSESRKV